MKSARLLGLLGLAILLAACRLDVAVDTTVNADGTGEVVVAAVVDKDVVDRVPGLAGSLVLDDATAAGWVVEGPVATEDGGLSVTLRHPFATVQEAANLLNSLGPPFGNVALERTATEDEITVTMSGSLSLPGGTWDAFGDQALLTSTGGTPFGAQLTESGANPAESMSVELAVRMPGEVEDTTGDRTRRRSPLVGSARRLCPRPGDAISAARGGRQRMGGTRQHRRPRAPHRLAGGWDRPGRDGGPGAEPPPQPPAPPPVLTTDECFHDGTVTENARSVRSTGRGSLPR